jgi:threonine/homoserine/homoserine lactone efflux protein
MRNQETPVKLLILIAGTIIVVVGALLMAEAIVSMVTNNFLFIESFNRWLELLIGLLLTLLGGYTISLSRE